MKGKDYLSLVCLLGLAVVTCAQEQVKEYQPPVLSLPLSTTTLVRERIPLTRALEEVGASLRNGYALFGVEVRSKDGQQPLVSLNLPPGSNLRDGLRQILAQLPGYNFKVVSRHMINIYPAGAKLDSRDVLNTFVPHFDVVDADPGQILVYPTDFIPELEARLTPKKTGPPQPGGVLGERLGSLGPRVTLHLSSVTIRQILNAVSEAMEQFPPDHDPVGWLYSFQPDPNSPIGGKHSWGFIFSVPRDWKQQTAGSKH